MWLVAAFIILAARGEESAAEIREIADRDPALTVAEDADSPGAPLGVVSITDVQHAVRAGGPHSRRRAA
jgi:hypothetical protein